MTQKIVPPGIHALSARFAALAPREQRLVLAAGAVVALALLWWIALAPALATLRAAPARHAALDAQLQRMQTLQAEAQQLQAAPKSSPADAVGALRTALNQKLGSAAQLNVVGDRATITFKGAPADALAQWLAQVRSNARTAPLEARWARSPTQGAAGAAAAPAIATAGRPAASPPPTTAPRWDGTLVLALPTQSR